MKKRLIAAVVAVMLGTACDGAHRQKSVLEPSATPSKSNWYVQTPSINPIDQVKTQHLHTSSQDQERRKISLVLTFQNGKLAGGTNASVRVDTHRVLSPVGFDGAENYHTSTRVMFDDEKAARQVWIITDDHTTLAPRDTKQFLVQMLHHKKLIVEFSYYEESPQTVTFDLTGLADAMKEAGLHDPTEGEARRATAASAKAAEESLWWENRPLKRK